MLRNKKVTVSIVNNSPDEASNFIIKELWKSNQQFSKVIIRPFVVTASLEDELKGGLVARSWWDVLEIQYLWLHETVRGQDVGKRLMQAAENEGRDHGCKLATVDTFSCQAPGFYIKLGYQEYGSIGGYAGKYIRHYLSKKL